MPPGAGISGRRGSPSHCCKQQLPGSGSTPSFARDAIQLSAHSGCLRRSGLSGPKADEAIAKAGKWTLEIVRRKPGARGFAVLPERWIAKRTLSWIRRNRRLARDFRHLAKTAAAFVTLAMIKLMLRRLPG